MSDVPRLGKPAKVGGIRFGAGCTVDSVVQAAIRQYEYDVTPEKEAARIKRAGLLHDLVKSGGQVERLRALLRQVLENEEGFVFDHGLLDRIRAELDSTRN